MDPQVRRSLEIMRSFEQLLGRPLIRDCAVSGRALTEGEAREAARRLDEAPFVVVAHGIEDDPILNYANQAALNLWETDRETLLQMPSRKTAEPMHRDERAQMLERTGRDGYIDDYQGVRISATGKRFRIEQAVVWNVVDEDGAPAGQAATFSDWMPLKPSKPLKPLKPREGQ